MFARTTRTRLTGPNSSNSRRSRFSVVSYDRLPTNRSRAIDNISSRPRK